MIDKARCMEEEAAAHAKRVKALEDAVALEAKIIPVLPPGWTTSLSSFFYLYVEYAEEEKRDVVEFMSVLKTVASITRTRPWGLTAQGTLDNPRLVRGLKASDDSEVVVLVCINRPKGCRLREEVKDRTDRELLVEDDCLAGLRFGPIDEP